MAQNPKSENDVRSLQQWYPKYLEHLFNAISYNPEVHSGTSCLVNYIQYIWQLTRKWVNTQPLRFLSKLNLDTLLNTENTFAMLFDWICHGTVLVTNWDKSQIATVIIPDLSQFVTVANCDGSKHNFPDWCQECPMVYSQVHKQVHIDSRPFQESFLGTSFMVIITDIHTKRCTSEITPESANMRLFIFMSKVNMGTLPSTRNTFSVLLESICHVKVLITNCDKSQIATIVSQFVTVAICDGSKYNFSYWCQLCQKVYT